MKISLLSCYFAITLIFPSFAQKGFKTEYQTFRFKLYDLLDEDNPMRISNALAAHVRSFLDSHAKEIPGFREQELRAFERSGIEDAGQYEPVGEEELHKINSRSVLMLTKEELIGMTTEENRKNVSPEIKALVRDWTEIENLSVMLEFQSVSPVERVHMANSQILMELVNEKFSYEMLPKIYGRMGITGTYLSTQRKDKTTWIVRVNSYLIVNTFLVDINTGDVDLVAMSVRKN